MKLTDSYPCGQTGIRLDRLLDRERIPVGCLRNYKYVAGHAARYMPQYTVGDIEAPPIATVPSSATLQTAIDEMFDNQYDQLGVERDGDLIGMVSFRSITRAIKVATRVADSDGFNDRAVEIAVEEPTAVVQPDDDLFTLFDLLADHLYVLVASPDETYHIITDWDLHHFLQAELEDFLLIAEIESAIRALFRRAYPDDLADRLTDTFTDMDEVRTPASIDDCSFIHYRIFLSKHNDDFAHYFGEEPAFARSLLKEVGEIRNQLFHFRSTGTSDDGTSPNVDHELIRYAHGYLTAVG